MVALGCMCDHNIYTHHFLVAVRCRSSYQHQSGILLSVFSFSLRRRSLVFKPKSGHKDYYLCFVLFLCSLKGSVLLRFNLLEKSDGLLRHLHGPHQPSLSNRRTIKKKAFLTFYFKQYSQLVP